MQAIARSIVAAVALIAAATLLSGSASAAQSGAVTASATIDGHNVAAAATGDPLPLNPNRRVDATVEVTNHGQDAVEITEVQLVGRVLGLTFFSYATIVDVNLAPGASNTFHYQLDLTDLKGQATGLLGGAVVIRDSNHHVVAQVPTVTDVRGSLMSVYGVFGLALLVLTVLALADAAFALARHRFSTNRWKRGLRLLTPGVGIGLVLVFTASVARWWVPRTEVWLLVAGGTAAAFFLLGYFSPTPVGAHGEDESELEETDDLDAAYDHDAAPTESFDFDRTVANRTVGERTVAEHTVAENTEVEKTADLQGADDTDLHTVPPKETGR